MDTIASAVRGTWTVHLYRLLSVYIVLTLVSSSEITQRHKYIVNHIGKTPPLGSPKKSEILSNLKARQVYRKRRSNTIDPFFSQTRGPSDVFGNENPNDWFDRNFPGTPPNLLQRFTTRFSQDYINNILDSIRTEDEYRKYATYPVVLPTFNPSGNRIMQDYRFDYEDNKTDGPAVTKTIWVTVASACGGVIFVVICVVCLCMSARLSNKTPTGRAADRTPHTHTTARTLTSNNTLVTSVTTLNGVRRTRHAVVLGARGNSSQQESDSAPVPTEMQSPPDYNTVVDNPPQYGDSTRGVSSLYGRSNAAYTPHYTDNDLPPAYTEAVTSQGQP